MMSSASNASHTRDEYAALAISQAESSNSPGSEDEPETTQSLTESITDYPVRDGRRYHRYKEGSYIFPNDEPENERLDLQHKLITKVHGGRIFFASLQNPRRILDVGTGTGIWPIEMANYFPNATIIGTDLSPIQPEEVPPNVHFIIDDAKESDWLYEPHERFDYIHSRCMLGSLPSFKALITNSFKYLNAGNGYLECQDWLLDLFCDDDSLEKATPYAFAEWVSRAHHASANSLEPPRPLRMAHKIAGWMREAGFVDVHEQIDKVPLNGWSKDAHLKNVGKWHMENWLEGLSGFSYGLFGSGGLGWNQTQIEVFLIGVRKSLQDRNVRAYQKFYVVTGRKPAPDEAGDNEESKEEE